jgi:hypothetical protein
VWLGRPSTPLLPRATAPTSPSPATETPGRAVSSPPRAPETAVQELETAVQEPETAVQEPAQPAAVLPERPARPLTRNDPAVASQPPLHLAPSIRPVPDTPVATPPPPVDEGPAESDVAAAVAPAASERPREPLSEAPREVPPRAEPRPAPAHAPAVAAAPAPAAQRAVKDSPVQDVAPNPPAAVTAPSGAAAAAPPPTVRERVTGWARSEAQDFRDGVKREIAEFRSGYDKVRDFFRRRDARSPAR